MKEHTRSRFIKFLSKENLSIELETLSDKELKNLYTRFNQLKALSKEELDIHLDSLSDKELKKLYVKSQKIKQGGFPYQALKKEDFKEVLDSGRLAYVTFTGTPGVRHLTLKEYLMLEEFSKAHPSVYPHFRELD